MKRIVNIIANFMSLASFAAIIYFAIEGIVVSYNHNTWDIFDTIILFCALAFIVLMLINLSFYIQNKPIKTVLKVIFIIATFIIGFLYIWFAIVKDDENLANGFIGGITMASSFLQIIFF